MRIPLFSETVDCISSSGPPKQKPEKAKIEKTKQKQSFKLSLLDNRNTHRVEREEYRAEHTSYVPV
jgi:hypothetical protein